MKEVLPQPEGTVENLTNPGADPSDGDLVRTWFDQGGYIEKRHTPTPVGPMLNVSLSKTKVSLDEQVSITASVTFGEGGPVLPVSDTYYVPIIRCSDGVQYEFLEFNLVDGVGSALLSISEKGIYEMAMDKIVPEPSSELSEVPKLVVI